MVLYSALLDEVFLKEVTGEMIVLQMRDDSEFNLKQFPGFSSVSYHVSSPMG